jgi:hypothetical protein
LNCSQKLQLPTKQTKTRKEEQLQRKETETVRASNKFRDCRTNLETETVRASNKFRDCCFFLETETATAAVSIEKEEACGCNYTSHIEQL